MTPGLWIASVLATALAQAVDGLSAKEQDDLLRDSVQLVLNAEGGDEESARLVAAAWQIVQGIVETRAAIERARESKVH